MPPASPRADRTSTVPLCRIDHAIDDSASMAAAQAKLARSIDTFLAVLEAPNARVDDHIAFTTTVTDEISRMRSVGEMDPLP